MKRWIAAALLLVGASAEAQVPHGYPSDYQATIDAARAEGSVVVYSVLSNAAAALLVRDFQEAFPGVRVLYDGEKGSSEMASAYTSEVAAGKASADVVWSSAMDLQMQLVRRGYAQPYQSPERPHLPDWANFRDLAFGTTFEPVAFVYNKERLAAPDVPLDHAGFAQLLRRESAGLRGRVTSFDIARSGVGFLFAAADDQRYPALPELLAALGAADVQLSAGTGAMLTSINSGEMLLGYDVMGSYALGRSQRDLPQLGVVFPRDFTLVLSRVSFISRTAVHPNAARLWTDYVLSLRGQTLLGDVLELAAVRDGVQARYTAANWSKTLGPSARPLPLSFDLTRLLDEPAHSDFLARWRAAIAAGRTDDAAASTPPST